MVSLTSTAKTLFFLFGQLVFSFAFFPWITRLSVIEFRIFPPVCIIIAVLFKQYILCLIAANTNTKGLTCRLRWGEINHLSAEGKYINALCWVSEREPLGMGRLPKVRPQNAVKCSHEHFVSLSFPGPPLLRTPEEATCSIRKVWLMRFQDPLCGHNTKVIHQNLLDKYETQGDTFT